MISIFCIPRASGDGPRGSDKGYSVARYSPRKRGWSRLFDGTSSQWQVFPAQAGMVLRATDEIVMQRSIPRASGDGPEHNAGRHPKGRYSPRKRGWSQSRHNPPQSPTVFPAQAGMVPLRSLRRGIIPSIPRASGDGPGFFAVRVQSSVYSPRKRGWSHQPTIRNPPKRVFPAQAGMVRSAARSGDPGGSIPRASGDGP